MIEPPCVVMVESILPEMRKRISKILRSRGWSEKDIADAVGVSQPMVSRYLSAENMLFQGDMEKEIDSEIEEIVALIEEKKGKAEIISAICRNCFRIREMGLMCTMHPVDGCRVCMNLRSTPYTGERREVLEGIRRALDILQGRISKRLVPEVRINIAYALPDAENIEEVAAVPGRLVEIRGELKALTEPEFGASRHLAGILLKAMKIRPEMRAAVNTSFNNDVERAIKGLGLRCTKFDGEKIPEKWEGGCLFDPGAYGKEPCLYIFGKNPEDVAVMVRKIEKMMKG